MVFPTVWESILYNFEDYTYFTQMFNIRVTLHLMGNSQIRNFSIEKCG